nr:MAG TPA: hypothetical protein [Caudoviricetes sp.]
MADGTTVSTPTDTTVTDTSATVEPTNDVDTSTAEPNTDGNTAETGTDTQDGKSTEPTLYAGKYKTVEELEKGYKESQKVFNEKAEIEKKYNDLLQQKETEYQKAEQQRLEQARQRGFKTAVDAEIADKIKVAEFEYYANNLNSVPAESFDTVCQYLLEYYSSGNEGFLNEAKRYFPSNMIENIALEKSKYETQLRNEALTKQHQIDNANAQKLADVLRADYAEFLGDIKENAPKAEALKMFCNTGLIQSKEDMQVFQNVYSNIEKYVKEQAIKEYEANKAIETTKQGAVISQGASGYDVNSGKLPTYEQIAKMTDTEYAQAYEKYGDKLLTVN